MSEPIFVKDGDTVVFIAKTVPTLSDPMHIREYVSQTYRVVSDSYQPTFELVSLTTAPVIVPSEQVQEYNERQSKVTVEITDLKFENDDFISCIIKYSDGRNVKQYKARPKLPPR